MKEATSGRESSMRSRYAVQDVQDRTGQPVQHLGAGGEPGVPGLLPHVRQQLVHLVHWYFCPGKRLPTCPGSSCSAAAWLQISPSAGRISRVGSVNLK